MGMPAARATDPHVCPMFNGPQPHVGGIIAMGSQDVMIEKMPAARQSDPCVCPGPPNMIAMGSATVFINKMPAARQLDPTAHGGTIVKGCATVFIG